MILRTLIASVLLSVSAAIAEGQRQPHVGYAYPAGGCQGTTVFVTVGGQFINNASKACISGTGIDATVVKCYRPVRNIDKEQREELMARFAAVRDKRLAELGISPDRYDMFRDRRGIGKQRNKVADGTLSNAVAAGTNTLKQSRPVEHPFLDNLEEMSLRELQHVANELLNTRMRQQNAQIGELVVVKLVIGHNAPPGMRELRLSTPLGLTNPLKIQIGKHPETTELEPNQPHQLPALSPMKPDPPLVPPVVINGQISPGDVDRFMFKARKGQNILVETHARTLIPYLADTVPGWFQATVAITDARSNVMAKADDYRFSPDPVIFWTVPESGVYQFEICDALYRGREDFVYRVTIAEDPYVTSLFPLGAQTGATVTAAVSGWNLPATKLLLDTCRGETGLRRTVLQRKKQATNPVSYMVGSLPETTEIEPNNSPSNAQAVTTPLVVNGRIGRAGDVDVFSFHGTSGQVVIAEVTARRLDSPLDSLIRIVDPSGAAIAMNDDCDDKEMGLHTHHADSSLHASLPRDDVYHVLISDSQQHGSPAHTYRLRIGAPQPDFALRMTPSTINVPVGHAAPFCVHVVRKDGFTGDVHIAIADALEGFSIAGATIPASRDRIRMTLSAPSQPLAEPASIALEGTATIDGNVVTRPVTPADDLVQAFAYRHLAPSQDLLVWTIGGKFSRPNQSPIALVMDEPLSLPKCGSATVRIKVPRGPMLNQAKFELDDPPPGVTLSNVVVIQNGLSLMLHNDGSTNMPGYADNLIVEAYLNRQDWGKDGKGRGQTQRIPLGSLPAIPVVIAPAKN